jgi:uncharacterized protein
VGRAAFMRGPLVYCVESVDNVAPVRAMSVPSQTRFTTEVRKDGIPGGVLAIHAEAIDNSAAEERNGLYRTGTGSTVSREAHLVAVPYYANANRGPVDMAVWLPLEA